MHGTQAVNSIAPLRTSLTRAALALVVITCGLSLRWYGFPLGLPAFAFGVWIDGLTAERGLVRRARAR